VPEGYWSNIDNLEIQPAPEINLEGYGNGGTTKSIF
jgi:hypothetical protein